MIFLPVQSDKFHNKLVYFAGYSHSPAVEYKYTPCHNSNPNGPLDAGFRIWVCYGVMVLDAPYVSLVTKDRRMLTSILQTLVGHQDSLISLRPCVNADVTSCGYFNTETSSTDPVSGISFSVNSAVPISVLNFPSLMWTLKIGI